MPNAPAIAGLGSVAHVDGYAFASALERLVDAADDLNGLVAAAESVLVDLVDADAAAYAEIDFGRWSFRARWTDDRPDFGDLMGRYHQLMEGKTVWTGSRSGTPQQFSDFMDDRTLYDSAIHRDVLRPLHVNRGAVFGISVAPNINVNFGLYRQSRSPFPQTALNALARIRPTISCLYGLSLVRAWSRLSPSNRIDLLDLPLTVRQRQVARLLVQGCTSDQIAQTLDISHETARNHVRSIYDRLSVQNRVGLTLALTSNPPDTLPISGCVSVGH
jgi:DNA-binding CsgD family transcriptional regulator